METIGLQLKKAKLSQQVVTLITDDGEHLTGSVEEIDDNFSVKVRKENMIIYVPLIE